MSYSNNTIRPNNNGNITVPDIQKALGTSADKASLLCTHDNIQKWSYYKPVRSSKRGPMTDSERENMFYAANDGFAIPVFDSPKEAVEALLSGAAEWIYEKPRGGQYNEGFRFLDFSGYISDHPNWFAWSGLISTTTPKEYWCYFPQPPCTLSKMIYRFRSFANQSSDGGPLPYYRIGLIAWVDGDSAKRAYFLNFGLMQDRQSDNKPLLVDFSDIDDENLGGKVLKFAPVITKYQFGDGDIKPPSTTEAMEIKGSWNKCYLKTPVGSSTEYFYDGSNDWWIMPVKPYSFTVSTQTPGTTLPDYFKWNLDSGYPKIEKVVLEDGTHTGYNVRMKASVTINTNSGQRVKLRIAISSVPSGVSQYVFENSFDHSVGLDVPPVFDTEDLFGNCFYDREDKSIIMFVAKDNIGLDNKIHVKVNIIVDKAWGGEKANVILDYPLTLPAWL